MLQKCFQQLALTSALLFPSRDVYPQDPTKPEGATPAVASNSDEVQQAQTVTVDGVEIRPVEVDTNFPIHRPLANPEQEVVGQGWFSFQLRQKLPTPSDMTPEVLKGAHGTVMVDPETQDIYWGVRDYGLIRYLASEGYEQAHKVPITNLPHNGFNMHGGELFMREGRLMFAAADDQRGVVYIGATSGGEVVAIGKPDGFEGAWKPTDVTVVQPDLNQAEGGRGHQLLITNGYGNPARVYIYDMDARTFTGHLDVDANTPHGITASAGNSAILAQRAAGELSEITVNEALNRLNGGSKWELAGTKVTYRLPTGMRPCDVDVFQVGDETYFLIPLLRSAGNATGKVAIANLRGEVVSIVDTGHEHIHDATIVLLPQVNGQPGFGVVPTLWNPGGPPEIYGLVRQRDLVP